jgi:hypothetical protein
MPQPFTVAFISFQKQILDIVLLVKQAVQHAKVGNSF